MGRLRDKVILITGAAGGIGSAIAEAVVRNGGIAIASDLESRPGIDHPLDVTSEADWQRVVGAIEASAGRLDAAKNRATPSAPTSRRLAATARSEPVESPKARRRAAGRGICDWIRPASRFVSTGVERSLDNRPDTACSHRSSSGWYVSIAVSSAGAAPVPLRVPGGF